MASLFSNELDRQLVQLQSRSLVRKRRTLTSPQGRQVVVDGKTLLNFCSNDYLGLANDQRVRDAVKDGVNRWGVGSAAADLVCGHSRAHHELELSIAEFTGREQALLFSSGYAANVGTVHALLTQGDQLFHDQLNHASLLDGGWLSRASVNWFPHRDYRYLAQALGNLAGKRRMIVSDGVFSMDGDQADIATLAELAQTHRTWLMIDDAHGIGVLGERGRGLVDPDQFSSKEVPVLVGTLGKALGTGGAFVAGDRALIDYLINKARHYIFSTAMPPAIAHGTLTSLVIAQEEHWRREHLQHLIATFRHGASALQLSLPDSSTPIQPILIGRADIALKLSQALEQRGLLIRAIRPPTVPHNTARLRINFSASHTLDDIDLLLNALNDALKEIELSDE